MLNLISLTTVTLTNILILIGASTEPRERLLFDAGWRFRLGHTADPAKDFGYGTGQPWAKAGEAVGAARLNFNDSSWRVIDLPHDWVVELPFDKSSDMAHGFKPVGRSKPGNTIGWYRRPFTVPKSDKGRRLSVEFDGVFRNGIVWLNGHFIGQHISGYTSFCYDITDYLNYGGRNVLVVRVDASEFEGWFYEGAGIYRHVWLTKTAPTHVAPGGIYVTSNVKDAAADVTARTRIINESDQPAKLRAAWAVLDAEGKTVATAASSETAIEPWAEFEPVGRMTLSNPRLWSVESPNLYRLATVLHCGSQEVDKVETPFGVRTIRFDPDKGFSLNGKPVKIKGVCCHQDHAGVGAALPDRIQYYRVERLKEMGCNAYRTSHNPPTPELLDACDRLGMLVMDEHRMMGSTPEIIGQLESLILRDRNHPSVVLWSIGNEEYNQGSEVSARLARSMIRTVRRLDPTRPTTYAGSNGLQWDGVNSTVDVRGVNYLQNAGWNLEAYHKAHPQQPILGSEEASTLSSRGIYKNDPSKGYVSCYDVNAPAWGSIAERWWRYAVDRPWFAGAFVWTGFDYRGEPTPYQWPCISSHFGIIDICGFPKDNFYYYQAWWSDKTVLHLLPHWNWSGREGQTVDVWCHSNCEKVELLLNGKSLGEKTMTPNSHLEWKVAYAPGVLEAKGYKGGQLVATRKVETSGPAARLVLTPDRSKIVADGEDVSMVAVSTVDAQGRPVPTADQEVRFGVKGNARIIGVGNGDPSCHEPDKSFAETSVRALSEWRMQIVDGVENRPEIAPEFDDSAWSKTTLIPDKTSIDKENTAAVYRTVVDIAQTDIDAGITQLAFDEIDDLGWVHVNGRLIGQTDDWSQRHVLDAKAAVTPGKNVIAVIVKNVGGQGGLNRAASLIEPQGRPTWKRSLFSGLAQVIVQAGSQAGSVELTAEAKGLEPAKVLIHAEASTLRPHVPMMP